jgi:dolichol-phosphate mannosyltransferase
MFSLRPWKYRWIAKLSAVLRWAQQFRYVRFGLVGASGTVVNLVVLYVGREYLFSAIEGHGSKPFYSLALAIFVATLNNFTWNRLWTWADRSSVVAFQAAQVTQDAQNAQTALDAQQATTLAQTDPHLVQAKRPWLGWQFAQYALASWLGIALQYGLTLWLSDMMHYMQANLLAIALASVSNFLANDRWTFRRRK